MVLTEDDLEQFYEGFSNDTLWPLYHDVIAPPAFHRQWWDVVPAGQPAVRAGRRRPGRPGRDGLGARLPAAAGPEDAARAAARPAHRLLPPHPVPAAGALRAAAVAQAGGRGAARRGPRRLPAGRRRRELRARGPSAHGPDHARADDHADDADGHGPTGTCAPPRSPSRSTRTRSTSWPAPTRSRSARSRSAASWATPSSCCSASTGSTTPRASGTGSRPTASCWRRTGCPRRARRSCRWPARAGRTWARTSSCATTSSCWSAASTATTAQVGHAPVQYLHQSFPMEEMAALYLAADVMLVTALRDGMNLVAKEYVAARSDDRGALVLSEFTGAADELDRRRAGQPARHRRDEGRDHVRRAHGRPRVPQADAPAAPTRARARRRRPGREDFLAALNAVPDRERPVTDALD